MIGTPFASPFESIKGGKKMENQLLNQKIAGLEFINDQLLAELQYVDQLLREIGFSEGLETIKQAAREVIEEEEYSSDYED